MFIISTTQTQHLVKGMKTAKNIELVFPDFNREGERYFPDGEVYAKIAKASRLKNKDTPNAKAVLDYEKCFEALCNYADYIAVNVSSPNTPHLRELQEKESLTSILKRIQELNTKNSKVILLKIAPDLTDGQLNDIIAIVRETNIGGVIATNTTTSRKGLETPPKKVDALGDGGLSGKPLAQRSTEIIGYLFKKSQGAFPIIGVGGIFSAEDAYKKIRAGASLVQIYTGLIYEGPGVVKKINQGLVELLRKDGFSSISQAVGVDSHG